MVESEEFLRVTLGSMDLVYNIARRIVPRPEDAEDLVQETYLTAFRAWKEYRRPRRVEPWLATICLNLGRSGFRHRARRPLEVRLTEDAPVEAEASPRASSPVGCGPRGAASGHVVAPGGAAGRHHPR